MGTYFHVKLKYKSSLLGFLSTAKIRKGAKKRKSLISEFCLFLFLLQQMGLLYKFIIKVYSDQKETKILATYLASDLQSFEF